MQQQVQALELVDLLNQHHLEMLIQLHLLLELLILQTLSLDKMQMLKELLYLQLSRLMVELQSLAQLEAEKQLLDMFEKLSHILFF
jgi:hypothetical protein